MAGGCSTTGFSSLLHKNGAHPRRENFHFLLVVSHTQIDEKNLLNEIKYQFFFFFLQCTANFIGGHFLLLLSELTEILMILFLISKIIFHFVVVVVVVVVCLEGKAIESNKVHRIKNHTAKRGRESSSFSCRHTPNRSNRTGEEKTAGASRVICHVRKHTQR